jgi:tetratricopeptide (TPR) repeat protein
LQAKEAQERGDHAAAIEKYQAITRIAPDLAPIYNNLGALYLKEHNFSLAIDALKRSLELDPSMNSASAMLGLAYFQIGENGKAEPFLRTAIRANPTDSDVEMTLSLILIDTKRYEEAVSHLNNIITRDPRDLKTLYLLRKTYLQMAEETRIKIDQIGPNSGVAHEIAGEAAESIQMYAAALVEYRKAIAMESSLPEIHTHIGDSYWHLGEWTSAQSEYKAQLRIDPDNCNARWKLADAILEARGSSEEALSNLNRSLVYCPALTQAHIDRARALIRLGRYAEALSDLLMAEKDKPTEASIHFLLASVYRAQHENTKAIDELHTFERLKQELNNQGARPAINATTATDITPK